MILQIFVLLMNQVVLIAVQASICVKGPCNLMNVHFNEKEFTKIVQNWRHKLANWLYTNGS